MTYDMRKFATSRWIKSHPNGVYTHGATEPVLTVLDVRGFSLREMLLIGFNDSCGTVVVPHESRAREASEALEPAYATRVYHFGRRDGEDLWAADYDRRALDGTTLSSFITDLTLKDGRAVIRDGRWTS